MKCKDCPYWWQEDGENYPRCQYEGPDAWAPCNQEEPEEYVEEGGDPYEEFYAD